MGGVKRLGHSKIQARAKKDILRGGRFAVAALSVLLSSLGSCASSAAPVPRAPEITRFHMGSGTEASTRRPPRCAEYSSFLRPGERAIDSICLQNTTYVRTNSSILIIPTSTAVEGGDSLSVSLSHSRVNIGNLVRIGIVDWAASDDTIFILTRDRRLNPIPRRGFVSSTRTRHVINGDITDAEMQFHAGLLFIGPVSDHLMVMSFSSGFQARAIPLPDQMCARENQEFIFNRGRLFFGESEGKQVEIRTRGGSIGALTLETR